jgi:eukaryotic-like serine/threonine-protein kinase
MADVADVDGLSELVLLPAGSTFGNYIIHECIGQGAMGNVYRAEHALLEKLVALKVLDSSLLTSVDARQRFLREGQAAAAIKHPNVVDITDVGVFEGTPYLVMELLEGEDLQINMQRGQQLSEREIASLLIPICAALGAAHDRGVIHRDLKPSNIFLARGADGEVLPKVLDFGISKFAKALATTDFESTPFDQLMGSPLYLPPEAVHGSRDLCAKSDQYSLGVVLYECVTGRPPFSGESLLSILNQISAGDFVRPSRLRSDVSADMERAIVRALNPDPALRFNHVRDLGRALLEVAGMRTQMLWGPTFGRIDLSDPPFDPTSTSPMALLRLASTSAAAAAPKPHHLRNILLGVVTLAAILIPNFWYMSAFRAASSAGISPFAGLPETGQAPLTPARIATDLLPSALPVETAARDISRGDGQPGATLPGATLPGATLPGATLPGATPLGATPLGATPPGATPPGATPPGATRSNAARASTKPADGQLNESGSSPSGTMGPPPRPSGERGAERSRRRARAAVNSDPDPHRLLLGPERLRARSELVGDAYPDDVRDLFPARDAVGREGGPASALSGANESPILD